MAALVWSATATARLLLALLRCAMQNGHRLLLPPEQRRLQLIHSVLPLSHDCCGMVIVGGRGTDSTVVGEGGVAGHELAGAVLREPAHSGPDGLHRARRQGACRQDSTLSSPCKPAGSLCDRSPAISHF